MGEGAGGPRSGRGRGGGRGEVRGPEGRRGAGGGEGGGEDGGRGEGGRGREPTRRASRSHSCASLPLFTSHLSLRTHAARPTPRRGRLAALPFLFRRASPPSVHPLRALAHPAQPGSLSAAGREARSQRGRGGSPGELEKMAELRAGRGCAASPTEAAPRAPRPSKRRVTFAALSPAPALRRFNSGSPGGTWYSFVPSPSPELRLLRLREAGVRGSRLERRRSPGGDTQPSPRGVLEGQPRAGLTCGRVVRPPLCSSPVREQ
ncbi:uncharacterized protein ACBT57_018767 [Dama dama]